MIIKYLRKIILEIKNISIHFIVCILLHQNKLTPHPKPPQYCPKRTAIKINARIPGIWAHIAMKRNHRVEDDVEPNSLWLPWPIDNKQICCFFAYKMLDNDYEKIFFFLSIINQSCIKSTYLEVFTLFFFQRKTNQAESYTCCKGHRWKWFHNHTSFVLTFIFY